MLYTPGWPTDFREIALVSTDGFDDDNPGTTTARTLFSCMNGHGIRVQTFRENAEGVLTLADNVNFIVVVP